MDSKELKVITDLFAGLHLRLDTMENDHQSLGREHKSLRDEIHGDDSKKGDNPISVQVLANKELSESNSRRLDNMEKQHQEMYKFYINLKGIIVGYSLTAILIGAALFKLINWIWP